MIDGAEKILRGMRGAEKIEPLLKGVPPRDGKLVSDNLPVQQKFAA